MKETKYPPYYDDDYDPPLTWAECWPYLRTLAIGVAIALGLLWWVGCVGALQGGTVTLPPIPVVNPAPPTFNVACVVTDPSGRPVEGAVCDLEGQHGQTNTDGYFLFFAVPGGDRNLVATKDGYTFGAVAFTNDHDQNVAITLTPIAPPAPTWTPAQLADFQGDLMIWAPGLGAPPGMINAPRGIQSGWVWSLDTYRYEAPGRATLYAAAKAVGFTHYPVQVVCDAAPGYHGLYPSTTCDGYGARINTVLGELRDHHLIAVCSGVSPDAPLAPGVDVSLCPVAMNDWDNSDQADCRIDALARTFPDALLYFELAEGSAVPTPDACSPVPFPSAGGAWLRAVQQRHPTFAGVLYETSRVYGPAQQLAYVTKAHAWWRDGQEVLFETDTYWKFWDGLDAAATRADNDALRAAAPFLRGCMSGCSTHAPIQEANGGTTTKPAVGDEIPAGDVTFVGGPTDIGSWPATATITRLELRTTGVHIEFTKQTGPDRWPDAVTPGWDGALQYSLGIAEFIGGQWVASAPIEFWAGLDANGGQIQLQDVGDGSHLGQLQKNWFYASRWGQLATHAPAPGEAIGVFVVAGDARNSFNPLHERSNLVVIPLPLSNVATTFVWK